MNRIETQVGGVCVLAILANISQIDTPPRPPVRTRTVFKGYIGDVSIGHILASMASMQCRIQPGTGGG